MTRRRWTAPPPPLPSSARRSRRSIHNQDLDEDLWTIPNNFDDRQDDNSESDDKPLRRPFWKGLGKRPWDDSFTSTLGKWVAATRLMPMSAQLQHPERRGVYIVLQQQDERDAVLQASKKVSEWAFEWLDPPSNVYIYLRNDSNGAGEQLIACNPGNLWRYEPCVDDMTGLIACTDYNAQTTLSGVRVIFMARVKPIAFNYVMFVNQFDPNVVRTAQIHSCWYEEIAKIDPAQRNTDPPHAYISVVNESSQWLFSSLTLCIRLSQRVFALVQQWYTAAGPRKTLFKDFEHSYLQ